MDVSESAADSSSELINTARAETFAPGDAAGRTGVAVARRVGVPIAFALTRVRAHAQRTIIAAVGVAVGAAVLAMTQVGSVAVQDRAVQRTLAQLQPSDRAVQANWSGVPAQSNLPLRTLDRDARRALRPVLGQYPFRVMEYRQATWGGAFVNLGAVDDLSRWLVVRSGRLPHPCRITDCELIQIGGKPASPHLPYLHVVGRAVFRKGSPLAPYFAVPGKRPPILLADGVRTFAHLPLPDVATIAREYAWVVPVAPGALHVWEIPGFQHRIDVADNRLQEATDLFSLSAPTGTLDQVQATSRVAGRRLLVVGGDAALLLLGFAVLASTRLRRDHRAVRRRLTWFGARRTQVALVTATEVAGLTVVSITVGWLAGTGAGGLLARHLGTPAAGAIAHSAFTGRSVLVALSLALVTAGVMFAALRAEPVSVGATTLSVADVAAIGALAAILLALARGKADTTSLAAGGGTGVVLLLLPGLVIFVLAVLAARLLSPLLRTLERSARRAPIGLRLALLSLARAPSQVILSVVFFVISVSVAVFAIAYRGTLLQGERDQARYAVPANYLLQEDLQQLLTIQQVATGRQYRQLGRTFEVLRDGGFVNGNGGRDFTLLALPPQALAQIQGWRSDFSSDSPRQLAKLIAPTGSTALGGLRLPTDATRIRAPLEVHGDQVGVYLIVLDRRGDFSTIPLGELRTGKHAPVASIPAEARGGTIVALHLTFPVIAAYVTSHKESESNLTLSYASKGLLRLGPLTTTSAQERPTRLRGFRNWVGTNGVHVESAGRVALLHFVVNRAADSYFRPVEPFEGQDVPVIVSPGIAAAAPGGTIPLQVEDQTITGHIVAVSRFFPSVDGDFVVADSARWFAASNARAPGSAVPSELWIDQPKPGAPGRLTEHPFSALDTSSQRAAYDALRGDPLARGTLAILLVTAIVGLALAAIGLLLTVIGDMRDESGELFDLEAQGATPADIRDHLLLRALCVAAIGLAGGLAAGVVVSALVVAVVSVTAGAASPLPPLTLVADWRLVLAALAAVVLASIVVSLAATRLAFDRVAAWRFSEGLE